MEERIRVESKFIRESLSRKLDSLAFIKGDEEKDSILRMFDDIFIESSVFADINGYLFNDGDESKTLYERIRLFDTFFKYSLTPIVFLDRKFNFIGVNEAYAASCQKKVEEFAGKNHFELYPNEENEQIFKEVVRTGKAHEARSKLFVFPDHPEWGETYWDWNLVPIKNSDGDIEFLVFSLRNVTDVKVAQLKIIENEKKYRQLVESVNCVIMKRTVDGEITFLNEYAQKFFGFSEDEIIGKNIVGTILPEKGSDGRDMRKMVREIGENPGLYVSNENQNIRKDGSTVWVSWTNKPVTDIDGKVVGILAVGSDITKRKHNELLVQITNTLLDLFIKNNSRQEYLDSVVKIIRRYSGFECAGIRLKDYTSKIPYISCMGFEDDFLSMENNMELDKVSCICTRVATKIVAAPDLRIALGRNSFGINDAEKFMESLTDGEKTQYWANCIFYGFNSIIVVPVVYQNDVLGVIHLADKAKGKATNATTELLEPIALMVAEAIHRFDVEEKLSESRERVKKIISCAPIILFAVDANGFITLEEGETLKKIGFEPGGSVGKQFSDVYREHSDMVVGIRKALAGEISELTTSTFGSLIFDVSFSHIKDSQGNINGVIGVATDITERVKAEKQILDYQSQLRSLNSELILAEERERRRIAEQLHDCLGPIISHSARQIGIIEKKSPPELSAPLKDVHKHLHDAVANTRALTFSISPPSLYNFGYEYAVEELTGEFEKMHDVKVDFACTGESNNLDQEVQILIYRSVRELMLNIVKHAGVTSASVVINRSPDSVKITVEDKGDGFDVPSSESQQHSSGYGLFSVKERIKHIGGYMDIDSAKGKGTTIMMYIPVVQSELS